jgi:PKD repeat protein
VRGSGRRWNIRSKILPTTLVHGATNIRSRSEGRSFARLLRSVACRSVVVSATVSVCSAATFVAFGPQTFTRDTGPPTSVLAKFSVVDPTTTYTMLIDSSGVSSALITLNGVSVVSQSDFNSNVSQILRPISLLPSNEVSVTLNGKPGERLTIQVIGVDNVAPTITGVVAPAPNLAGWNNTSATVTFTCFDKTSGIASCTPPVAVSTEGANQVVTGTATDRAGNVASTSLTVRVDKTAPTIAIPSPANGSSSNTTSVPIQITFGDGLSGLDLISFSAAIDGIDSTKSFIVNPGGASYQASLAPGTHSVVANIRDIAGNSSQAVSQFTVTSGDTTPPVLVTNPADGAVVGSTSPVITISYSDAGSGVDTTTFAVTIDGINYLPQFTVGPSSATSQPTLSGGQHVIAATIKDKVGNTGQITSQFTIASFLSLPDATPRSGAIPLTVRFITNAIYTGGAITKWQWDFQGDGVFDTNEIGPLDHTFTFTTAGVYNAVLKVTNDKGQTASATVQITATHPLPTATASVNPSNGGLPLTVTLTGTGTSSGGTIVKYEWDRLGNGTFDYASTTTGTTTFNYTQAGTYNAVFRVTDSFGQTATAVATATAIRVGPPGAPTAKITSPANPVTANAPLNQSFNGTGTASTGRTITKYEWDFNGDGTFDYTSATTPSTSFTYTSPGTYTTVFRVTDSNGDTGFDTKDITVNITASLTLSTDTVRPASGGTVDVRTTIGGTTPVTIVLKNKAGQVVRTLVNNVTRNAGSYTDTWDGKDENGVVVPDGVFYAILQYKAGGNTITVDLTNSTGNVVTVPSWTSKLSASGKSCTFTFFSCQVNPFTNDFFEVDFTLAQALEITLDLRQINTTIEIVKLLDRQPFGRGAAYSLFWDGTDSAGKALQTPSGDGYLWGMLGYTLPTNGVYVENRPVLSSVTATPNYFDPGGSSFTSPSNPTTTISYTLSKPATLSLQVFRSGTNTLMRTITQTASTGPGTIQWDGRADNGLFVDVGDYHLGLKAVDAAGNQSIVRYVMERVFY